MARKIINTLQSNLILVTGILLILIFVGWRYHQVRILSFNTTEVAKSNNSGVRPVHIKAYPVGVNVAIQPAIVIDGVWPVFPKTAGYVTNENNLIIYGHNKDNIFGPIRYIKVGAVIEIIDSNKKVIKYEVVKTDTVDPNNLSYIQSSSTDVLTLYTCTGFLDTKRFIVVATLKK